jgi:glycosyltransferase involved in cell wall biosynthesis
MRIALLTSDTREVIRNYSLREPSFGTAPEALMQGFARLRDIEVHVVSCLQQPVISPAKLAENVWYHGLHVPKAGWLRTGYQGCIRAARRKLRELGADIVHGQGTERDCAISAVYSGLPNVLTIHGNMRLVAKVNRARPFTFLWLAARLERLTIPRSAGVVCITRYTQEAVASLARATWIVPNAVDAAFFSVTPAPVTPKLLLCVGNISVRKNQNHFIRALDAIAKPDPRQLQVLFLGAAPDGDDYVREFFELLESRPWCRFGGLVGRAELRRHFAQASALALPSLEDNCPMVILEAMAAGVPSAASRVGGVPELIDHGRTGFLFDPHKPESMADAVRCLIGNSEETRRVAAAARQEALARFHPERIAEQHIAIYREVLKTRS